MPSQGAFLQKVWHICEIKVAESWALHRETGNRVVITENNFWLISKPRSKRPDHEFLKASLTLNPPFLSIKDCDQDSLVFHSCLFSVFRIVPQSLSSKRLPQGMLSKWASSQNLISSYISSSFIAICNSLWLVDWLSGLFMYWHC